MAAPLALVELVDEAADVVGGGAVRAVHGLHGFPHTGELVVGGVGEVAAYAVGQGGIGGGDGIVVETVAEADYSLLLLGVHAAARHGYRGGGRRHGRR